MSKISRNGRVEIIGRTINGVSFTENASGVWTGKFSRIHPSEPERTERRGDGMERLRVNGGTYIPGTGCKV